LLVYSRPKPWDLVEIARSLCSEKAVSCVHLHPTDTLYHHTSRNASLEATWFNCTVYTKHLGANLSSSSPGTQMRSDNSSTRLLRSPMHV
jgi:hypothetical protein